MADTVKKVLAIIRRGDHLIGQLGFDPCTEEVKI